MSLSQQELYFIKSKEMYQNFWVKNDPMYHMWKCHHRIFNVINSDVFSDIQNLLFKDYVILNVLTCSRNVWPLLEAKFACNRTSERQRSQKREQIQLHHFWEGRPTPVVESSRVLHIFAPFHSMLPWPFCFWTAGPGTGVGSTFATMAECELGVELFSFSKVSCITLIDTFWTPSNFLSKGRTFSFLSKQDSCLPSCDVAIHPNSLQLWSLFMKWSTHVALGLGDVEPLLGLGQLLLKLGLDHLLLCQPARN